MRQRLTVRIPARLYIEVQDLDPKTRAQALFLEHDHQLRHTSAALLFWLILISLAAGLIVCSGMLLHHSSFRSIALALLLVWGCIWTPAFPTFRREWQSNGEASAILASDAKKWHPLEARMAQIKKDAAQRWLRGEEQEEAIVTFFWPPQP